MQAFELYADNSLFLTHDGLDICGFQKESNF